MRILLNQKPVEQLTKTGLKDLVRAKPFDEISGIVLTGEAATARVMRTRGILFGTVAFVALAVLGGVMIGVILDGPSVDQSVILAALPVTLVVVGLVLRWGYRRTGRLWHQRLPERIAAMPPPGTDIRLDAVGITVGGVTSRWSQLRIEQLDVIVVSNGEDSTFITERVILAGGPAPITLDTNLIDRGRQIVDTACRRLLVV